MTDEGNSKTLEEGVIAKVCEERERVRLIKRDKDYRRF